MSKVIGDRVPDVVASTFDGTDLAAKLGLGFVMITVDPDGQARPCMLSAGELLVVDRRTVRMGLWAGSSTSRNLTAGSSVLFCHVAEGVVFYLRGTARPLASNPAAGLDCFELRVDRVETDSHDGLPVTSGITFTVVDPDPPAVLAMWERQLAVIRAAS